jgi:hypothetical protein
MKPGRLADSQILLGLSQGHRCVVGEVVWTELLSTTVHTRTDFGPSETWVDTLRFFSNVTRTRQHSMRMFPTYGPFLAGIRHRKSDLRTSD